MSNDYGVYHYDTIGRETGQAIIEDVSLTKADAEAAGWARSRSAAKQKGWKRVQKRENCVFQIEDERMGVIVMKNNRGPDYNLARKSQSNQSA